MKTIRELLLERHRAAEIHLDRIRRQVVAEETQRLRDAQSPTPHAESAREKAPALRGSLPGSWITELLDLLHPARAQWAGLAAVWAVILALYVTTPAGGEPSTSRAFVRTPAARQALREHHRALAELLGSEPGQARPSDAVIRPRPTPRSDRRELLRLT